MTRRVRSPFALAQVVGWLGYGLLFHLFALPTLGDSSAAGQLRHLGAKLWMSLLGLAASLVLAACYRRLWPRRLTLARLLFAGAGLSIGIGAIWAALYRSSYGLVGLPIVSWAKLPLAAMQYGIVLMCWSAVWWLFAERRELEAERERALRATALASQAQLQMLRYQVHPHFLFNALNSLRALIEEDPARARQMVTELAEFFRYSLLAGGDAPVRLGDELDAVRSYLAIQRIRFEERLDATVEVDATAEQTMVPGLLVHPLVENAVKYGMETSTRPLRVRVRARQRGGEIEVEVANTGRLVSHQPGTAGGAGNGNGTGTGLANVRQRLEQLLPQAHRLTLSEGGGWVRATLSLQVAEARPARPGAAA